MENMEEIFHFLEDFSKRKPKVIPQELNEYLAHVARTGDPVYQWALVKCLFKEKLLNVITDFYETTPSIDIPPYPNVDPFNYEAMKNSLLERLDSFASAPFTVQRICELLTFPRKQYNRVDKFMRAVEKNILVVSTREPGSQRHSEPENGEPVEPIVNGSDNNSDYNVDVEMEDMSWKENAETRRPAEPQPSSSDTHISVDDIEARLNAKQDIPMQVQEKTTAEYESVTPPELNVAADEQEMKTSEQETKPSEEESKPTDAPAAKEETNAEPAEPEQSIEKMEATSEPTVVNEQEKESKVDVEMEPVEMEPVETENDPLVIPEIKVDDADMTEQRLAEESKTNIDEVKDTTKPQEPVKEEIPAPSEEKVVEPSQPTAVIDETSSDAIIKDDTDSKVHSEVLASSEESQSSSSDNADGNSNSPKMEPQSDSQESSSDANIAESSSDAETKPEPPEETKPVGDTDIKGAEPTQIQSDNYSISDVKSELAPPPAEAPKEIPEEKSPLQEESKDKEIVPEPVKEETEKTEAPVTSEN